jgi:Lon protease-like protein
MPVSIVLQKLVETLRNDDYEARKLEESQRKAELLRELEAEDQRLPVLLMHEILYLPGIIAELRIFEPRYVQMIQTSLNSTRQFGIYSTFKGSHLGVVLEISSCEELHDGTIRLVANVKRRFLADGITSDFQQVIPSAEISMQHYSSDELFYCIPQFIVDEETTVAADSLRELNGYVERCISFMLPSDRRSLLNNFHPQMDRSFFALSVLDIGYDTVIRNFQSTNLTERIEECLEFTRSRPASQARLRVKSSRWLLDSTWATVVLIVGILLVFVIAD